MKASPDRLIVAVHPSIGDLHVGDFVSISSGSPSNPYLARISGKQNDSNCVQIQWCWRPTELLDYMLKAGHAIPPGRTVKSFAHNEVVLGTRTEPIPINSILGRTEVFLISDIIAEGKNEFYSWFFYRQVVVDDSDQWRLEPPLVANVVDLTQENHPRLVENPGVCLRYCSARLSFSCDSKLFYDVGDERLKEVWESHEPFTCPSCMQEEGGSSSRPEKKKFGTEWLGSVDLAAIEAPADDSKRMAVIDKFYSVIEESGYEETESVVVSRGDLLRFFCIELEREIYVSSMGKPRDYKSRVYTISFNLSDKRNSSLRRRIIEGEFSPHTLATANSETLASEDVQVSRQEQRDKYFTTQVLKPREDEGADLKKQRVAMGEVNAHLLNAVETIQESSSHSAPVSQYEDQDVLMNSEDSNTHLVPETEVIAIGQQIPANDQEQPELPQATQDNRMEKARNRLLAVADRIREKLSHLEYESQRLASVALVDYIMKHV
jgi:hypothetical protein